jgi:hypothetical protein
MGTARSFPRSKAQGGLRLSLPVFPFLSSSITFCFIFVYFSYLLSLFSSHSRPDWIQFLSNLMCLEKYSTSLLDNRWPQREPCVFLFIPFVMTSVIYLICGKCFFKYLTICITERTCVCPIINSQNLMTDVGSTNNTNSNNNDDNNNLNVTERKGPRYVHLCLWRSALCSGLLIK